MLSLQATIAAGVAGVSILFLAIDVVLLKYPSKVSRVALTLLALAGTFVCGMDLLRVLGVLI